MAIPPYSAQPPQLPPIELVAPIVPVSDKGTEATPFDVLIFTSKEDWQKEIGNLREAAGKVAVNAGFLFAEDLEGGSTEDQLDSLNDTLAALEASGKIDGSTMLWVKLHGGVAKNAVRNHAHAPTAQDDTAESEIDYRFGAQHGKFVFPGMMLASTLRYGRPSGDTPHSGFKGLIVWSACQARNMERILKSLGGENLLLAGKKNMLSDDGQACLFEVFDLIAIRKREGQPPLTGRDYWMHLRNVSGEHIAYVQDDSTEIHKVLASGSSEPVLKSRTGRSAEQAQRILDAKIVHGSPKAIEAVFEKYGKDHFSARTRADIYAVLVLDKDSDTARLQEKMAILEKYGFGFPRNLDELLDYLDQCVGNSNVRVLSMLLQSRRKEFGSLLPKAIEEIALGSMDLLPDLEKLFTLHEDIMQQWLSVYREWLPTALGSAIDRYLKNTIRDDERPKITARLCLATRDHCLTNLLRNAFELNKDLAEARSLMPYARILDSSSRARSYLNVVLNKAVNSGDDDTRDLFWSLGMFDRNVIAFEKSRTKFPTDRHWID